ncbi:hypothetical protein PSACC_02788, partial [Paramicrosporidium saccamoebae]
IVCSCKCMNCRMNRRIRKRAPVEDSMAEIVHTIECIAVVGKQNNPLWLKNFTEKPELDLHYFVNVTLDAIDERRNSKLRLMIINCTNAGRYALCTATRIKFIAVVRWSGRPPKEASVKTLLQEVYTLYISLVSNPFYTIDSEVRGRECSKFVNFINTLKL